jgi:PAS domain S-box-containing protein
MNYYFSYFHFFAATIYGILGIIIFSRDYRSRLNQSCACVFGCHFLWSFSFIWIHHPAVSVSLAKFFLNFSSPAWISVTFFHLWFAWIYTRRRPFQFFRPCVAFFIAVLVFFIFQQVTNGIFMSELIHRDYGWLGQWNRSIWTYSFLFYYLFALLAVLYLIFDYRNHTDNTIIRQQSLVLLISGMFSIVIGALLNIILPLLLTRPPAHFADVTSLIWALSLAYVAVKYRMLDITPFIAAKRIITVMKDLLFLLDTHGRIISVNPSTLSTLACTAQQLIGKPFIDIIGNTETERGHIADRIRDSSAYTGETVLVVASGPLIPVALSTSLIPGTGIVCAAHDISLQKQRTESLRETKRRLETEVSRATDELRAVNKQLMREIDQRKQAALTLMETEERFRVIFEYTPDGIFLADQQGYLMDANNEAQRITGYAKDELVGRNASTLGIPPFSERGEPVDVRAKNLLDAALCSKEATIVRKDLNTVPAEINAHHVKIGDRNLILGVVRDLSQRKKAEAEAEQLKRDLHQAQKMEAIGRLAGGIAHDFNNLLGGIIGFAGLLRKHLVRQLPSEVATVQKIIDAARQASDHAAQLLAFARKGKYQITPVVMHDVIADVIGLLEHTIDRKIRLAKRCDAPSSTIMGDRSQLHSALLNLGVNARDALPDGGVITFATGVAPLEQIPVRGLSFTVKPEAYLTVAISDNGIGMDEETRSRLFEPFFSTKEPGKGTGLGLASVYGTVVHHSGFIEVMSEKGKGTTFTISLPLTIADPVEEEAKQTSGSDEPCMGNILIVDDILMVREVMAETLKDCGYTVHECSGGHEAIAWFREHHEVCDLAILDFTMPEINGKECFRTMKKLHPALKAIITSGHAIEGELNDLMDEGAVTFLHKPFEIEQLSDTVKRTLSGGGTSGAK